MDPVVDDHIIYALSALLPIVLGAGLFLGVDGWIERRRFVKRRPKLRAVLG